MTTVRPFNAMTIDEFYEVRNNATQLPAPKKWKAPMAPPTNIVRPVFDLDGHALTVTHIDDSMTMRFTFNGATADLDLVQAKRLASSLADALNAWRDTMTNASP